MRQITSIWDNFRISSGISKVKPIFIEPKEELNCKFMVPDFYKTVLTNGALLILTSTGSLASGLDFSDDVARTIIQVGIPFPNLGDPKTIMKKEYLDKLKMIKKDQNALNGQKWYLLQATRLVNHLL
jgi:Rad3-related DNA helicase